jgi:hypothetical protein
MMLAGGSDAEDQVNLTASVWRNAIYQDSDPATNKYVKPQGIYVSDFNIALKNLYADPTIITKISNIKDNQTTVRDLMKGFQNPPKGLEACYITVTDLYTAYSSLTDMAVNPSGSLTSFTADKSTKVNAFMDAYKKLETQIPDKIGNK